MASKDLTPEEFEDLVESGHCCDEACASGDHSRSWTEQPPDDITTALAQFVRGAPDASEASTRSTRRGSSGPTRCGPSA